MSVVYFQFGGYITVCCLFSYFLFHFPAWRSHGVVWINHDDHVNAESKIESIRYFIWKWNWNW